MGRTEATCAGRGAPGDEGVSTSDGEPPAATHELVVYWPDGSRETHRVRVAGGWLHAAEPAFDGPCRRWDADGSGEWWWADVELPAGARAFVTPLPPR